MSERTIQIYAKSEVSITYDSNGRPVTNDVIGRALNGDAFSWERPSDLSLTFSGPMVDITFDDADGVLTDDPFSGSKVVDQRLTQPLTVDGVTYLPNDETIRWKNPPPVNVENEYEVTLFDDSGTAYRMVGVSITQGYSTSVVGVMFDGPAPPPGTTLHYIQGVSSYGGTGQSVTIPDQVPCFLAGTQIETPDGPRRIETLRAGGQVLTLDSGAQTILWIGRRAVCGLGNLAPIRIGAGVLGNRRDLFLSPQHRVLLRSPVAELHFGHRDVLVPAKSLVDGARVRPAPMPRADYLHILLENHEMLFSEGIATESLFAGAMAADGLPSDAQAELRAIFPGCETSMPKLCHPALSMAESRYLARRAQAGANVQGVGLQQRECA